MKEKAERIVLNNMGSMSQKSDEEIAALVQHGDVEAFGILVERYEQKLSRYARKFLQSQEDKKDLVQEVFLKTYSNIQSFNPSMKFSPWIYRIAHNEFINSIKKKGSKETISVFDFDTFFPQPVAAEMADTDMNRSELKTALDKFLNQLDAKYREPLILHYYQDLGYKEIADVLHVPVSTVGVRLARGKAMLQKMVEPLNLYG